MQRKCCNHCPGDVTRTGEPAREHSCGVSGGYVSGNIGLSFKFLNDKTKDDNLTQKFESQGSCYERFATARKFHVENLEHQPLPDRVDDAIFTNDKLPEDIYMLDTVKRCQRILPRRQTNRKKELNRLHRYAPALGCKKPTTYMDLAICWETPVNPNYEPRKSIHIDGTDGGSAPAVFNLVQHDPSKVDVREGSIPGCKRDEKTNTTDNDDDDDVTKDELCKNLNSINLSGDEKKIHGPVGAEARKKRAEFLRHCSTNVGHDDDDNVVFSNSCLQKRSCSLADRKKNNVSQGKLQIPRPRTPYARRSFCIDTLKPPFSLMNGCRDTDYPEHWRLTSIYQQSYRNPKKMREGRTLLRYDRSYH